MATRIAPTGDSDQPLDAHIPPAAITVHHPAGTCRMGPDQDPDRVVDRELRVIGTRDLRVVDASVMPDLVGGNINVAVRRGAAFAASPRSALGSSTYCAACAAIRPKESKSFSVRSRVTLRILVHR